MVNGLSNTAKSLQTKMRNLEIIANNLANINTTGYKKQVAFLEYLSGAEEDSPKQITDFSEGEFIETGNKFDMAVSQKGFFVIETDRGKELTKNGKFKLDESGNLVNEQGHLVQGQNGSINIFEHVVSKDADVTVTKGGEVKIGEMIVDRLMIAKIDDQTGMTRTENENFYFADQRFHIAEENEFTVLQGYLEESNTNPVIEMQSMISLNRDFQAAQKMIHSFDDIMGKSKEIGKVY